MDWQVIEVGGVATLALWVLLFSPSTLSRGVAALMFVLNIVWIFRERPAKPASRPRTEPETARDDDQPPQTDKG